MNYYVNSNLVRRLINTHLKIEMPSYEKPFYFILNYHCPEEKERMILNIDKIFGLISNKKITTNFIKVDWYELIDNMLDMEDNEFLIKNFITNYVTKASNASFE